MNNQNPEQNPTQGFNIVTGPATVPGATFNTPPTDPAMQPVNPTPTGGVTLGQVAGEPINPQPSNPMPMAPTPTSPQPIGEATMNQALNPQPSMPTEAPVNPMPAPAPTMPMPNAPVAPETLPTDTTGAPTPAPETPKKKSKVPIILIVVLLLLVGGFCVYYYVLDNPKTIFMKAADGIFDKATTVVNNNKGTTTYNLGLNISSEGNESLKILEVINNIKLKGTYATDGTNNVMAGTINYKDNELLNYALQTEENNIYVKLNLITNESEETEEIPQYSTDINDYKKVMDSIKKALNTALNNAQYKKQLVSLNGAKAKKLTIKVDEKFITTLCSTLMQDSSFLESYSKITNKEQDAVSDGLRKSIEAAKNNDEDISLYLTLKNEFKKLEYEYEKDKYSVDKDGNQYNFDIVTDGTELYNGYVKISESNNQKFLNVSVNLLEEKVKINGNAIYAIDSTKGPELLDTGDAVKYEELSEEDTNLIMSKLMENEAFKELLNDTELDSTDALTSTSDM